MSPHSPKALDSFSFSKETLLEKWNQQRQGCDSYRGTYPKERANMQVEVADFLRFVEEQQDDDQ
jgi:hypothetical protein